jgi:hypothetical protein
MVCHHHRRRWIHLSGSGMGSPTLEHGRHATRGSVQAHDITMYFLKQLLKALALAIIGWLDPDMSKRLDQYEKDRASIDEQERIRDAAITTEQARHDAAEDEINSTSDHDSLRDNNLFDGIINSSATGNQSHPGQPGAPGSKDN